MHLKKQIEQNAYPILKEMHILSIFFLNSKNVNITTAYTNTGQLLSTSQFPRHTKNNCTKYKQNNFTAYNNVRMVKKSNLNLALFLSGAVLIVALQYSHPLGPWVTLPVINDINISSEPIPVWVCEGERRIENEGRCFH